MLIRTAEQNETTRNAAPRQAYCALCMHDLYFPRIQLPDRNIGQNVYHVACAAKVAASITKDLQKLLEGIIL